MDDIVKRAREQAAAMEWVAVDQVPEEWKDGREVLFRHPLLGGGYWYEVGCMERLGWTTGFGGAVTAAEACLPDPDPTAALLVSLANEVERLEALILRNADPCDATPEDAALIDEIARRALTGEQGDG